MPWDLQPVEVDFFEHAPFRFVGTEVIRRPAETVWDALALDPAGWGRWYPGFSGRGHYLEGPDRPHHQTGAVRRMYMAGVTYDETILAWDRPHRWAFRVDRATVPLAHALAEEYRIVDDGDACIVQWTFAVDPRAGLKLGLPLMEPFLGRLLRRSTANLERDLGR